MKRKGFTLIELPVARKRGFTLIELIVVIAIIGILATIILVAVSNQTPRAQRAAVVETGNRLYDAINICEGAGDKVIAPSTPGGTALCAASGAGDPATLTVWPATTASGVITLGPLGANTCQVTYNAAGVRFAISGATCNTAVGAGNVTVTANGFR